MRGWYTKYALTLGIVEIEGDECEDGRIWLRRFGYRAKIGRDFFLTKEEAEEAARIQARKKIASLKAKAQKLNALVDCPKHAKGGAA